MDLAENIGLVINTLENVEVKGSKNWDRMLACIQHLNTIRKEMMNNEGSSASVQQRNPEGAADTV